MSLCYKTESPLKMFAVPSSNTHPRKNAWLDRGIIEVNLDKFEQFDGQFGVVLPQHSLPPQFSSVIPGPDLSLPFSPSWTSTTPALSARFKDHGYLPVAVAGESCSLQWSLCNTSLRKIRYFHHTDLETWHGAVNFEHGFPTTWLQPTMYSRKNDMLTGPTNPQWNSEIKNLRRNFNHKMIACGRLLPLNNPDDLHHKKMSFTKVAQMIDQYGFPQPTAQKFQCDRNRINRSTQTKNLFILEWNGNIDFVVMQRKILIFVLSTKHKLPENLVALRWIAGFAFQLLAKESLPYTAIAREFEHMYSKLLV